MNKIYSSLLLFASIVFGIGANGQTTFSYTGSVQTYTVPAGVTEIQIECWGAQGPDHGSSSGGLGGYVSGELTVTPGQVLEIYVGGTDGYNGGGAAGTGSGSAGYNGLNGGGASDVRIGTYTLAERVIVAGGGGGAGRADCGNQDGGDGGYPGGTGGIGSGIYIANDGTATAGGDAAPGACGGDCACSPSGGGGGGGDGGGGGGGGYSSLAFGTGGTAGACGTAGGSSGGHVGGDGGCFGLGGDGGSSSNGGGAGGGGGWYGGGAGGSNWAAGGGGGSSYFDAAISSTAFTNGTNSGDGQVVITELCNGLVTTVSEDTVCVGDEVILHAESTGSGTISWSGGITDSVAFTPSAGTTTYTATSTDANDCEFSIDIFVGDYPTADAGTDTSICEGDSIQLAGTGSGTDMMWDGGFSDGDWVTPATAGTNSYELTVSVDSTGCATVDTLEVEYNVIDPTVTYASGTLTSATAGATYQWIDCSDSSDVSGATSQDFTPSQNGDYAVIVDLNGCVDTSACETVGDIGVLDYSTDAAYAVYPNPATSDVTIKAIGTFTYSITDASGRIVMMGEGEEKVNIDLGSFEPGTYVVSIQGEEQYFTKLIKK